MDFRSSVRRRRAASIHYHSTRKPPAWAGGSLAHTAGFRLPADLEAGPGARTAANGAAGTVTVGDHLDPQCILVLEVRGVARLARRVETVLRRTRGCGGESRQLEDHPRAGIHFRQGEGQ